MASPSKSYLNRLMFTVFTEMSVKIIVFRGGVFETAVLAHLL
jgi:hypothetical protein